MTQIGDFKEYAVRVVENAKVFEKMIPAQFLFTGGTDKHYVVFNVKGAFNISGTDAEKVLERIGILSSRQSIPSDSSCKMSDAGGLRLGSAWATSRGYDTSDFEEISGLIMSALSSWNDNRRLAELQKKVAELAGVSRQNDVWLEHGGTGAQVVYEKRAA